jgi:hypothetical protein
MPDDHDSEPTPTTQFTQPKKGKPIEIPIPTEGDVMHLFEKIAHAPAQAGEKSDAA